MRPLPIKLFYLGLVTLLATAGNCSGKMEMSNFNHLSKILT